MESSILKNRKVLQQTARAECGSHPFDISGKDDVMAGPAGDDSQVFFEMAHKSLVHHALGKPGAGDDWVLFNGLSVIATGLEILSAELKATRREIAELKTLLQLPPKRAP